jgi:hypothetical protein
MMAWPANGAAILEASVTAVAACTPVPVRRMLCGLLTGMYQLPYGKGRNFMNSGGVKGCIPGWLGSDNRDIA